MLLSIGIHAVILLVGGYLVVSQIAEDRKISFGGGDQKQQAELQHKVKRRALPSAPAPNKRITTKSSDAKVALPDMPEVARNMGPSIAGSMGSGGFAVGTGLGGAGGLAAGGSKGNDFSKVNFFGLRTPSKGGGEFIGTFYDLKQTRGHQPTNMTVDEWTAFTQKWVKDGWDVKELQKYYAGPHQLRTPFMFIPCMAASEGPKAFGLEREVKPGRWVAHYKAKVVSPVSGKYRFVGVGDDALLVRFNGKVVLNSMDPSTMSNPVMFYHYEGMRTSLPAGVWFNVNAGTPNEMELLIGENPGGLLYALLLIERANAHYEKDPKGLPILPVFRLSNAVPSPMSEKDIKAQVKDVPDAVTFIGKAPPFSIKDAPWSTVADKPVSALDLLKKATEKPADQ